MKIDEGCINHNALRLIDDVTANPYEWSEQSDCADHQRILTIGYVRGVIDMAKELKEVLKA